MLNYRSYALAVTIGLAILLYLAAGSLTYLSSPEYKRISPQDAKQRLETKKTIVLLDVRTQEEHHEKRIPGSTLIPVDNLAADVLNVIPDKQTVIIIYCRSGRRSEIAARMLLKLGYREVFDLGGINDWPYEVQQN